MCILATNSDQVTKSVALKTFSMKEVRTHRTLDDAWVVNYGKVYDVSGWKEHPGGRILFSHAGEDCTNIFTAFHPASSYNVMSRFLIGELDKSSWEQLTSERKELYGAYRGLRMQLMDAGLFEANKWYYVYKVLSNVGLGVAGWALIVWSSGGLAAHLLGAVLMALFWQQSGWLAHDFVHGQVFDHKVLTDFFGVFCGNVMLGFSRSWWGDKHNYHHAVPNMVVKPERSNCVERRGDPDADTMPLIAWSLTQAKAAKENAFYTFMVKHQAWLYVPLLLFARFSWLLQSFAHAYKLDNSPWATDKSANTHRLGPYEEGLLFFEKIGLVLHFVWVYFVFSSAGLVEGLFLFMFAQMSCGLFLAIVFGLGHNGMAVYDSEKDYPDFWTLQITTTRNVISTPFVDWFCGGLQHQVEHHLFPTLPRHNLGKAKKLVEQMCKENNVAYHEASMWDGTKEVFRALHSIAVEFGDFSRF
eukprot:30168_1